jgi:hypothetical protein
VSGLTAPRARVRWGDETKEFTREQLAAGVNLAAEFPRTPFDAPFAKLQQAIAEKQAYETFMIKQIVTNFRLIPGLADDAEAKRAAEVLAAKLVGRWKELDGRVHERLVAVPHAVVIEPQAG